VREACATCEMGYVRAIYVLVMRLFLVHIDRHRILSWTRIQKEPTPGLSTATKYFTIAERNGHEPFSCLYMPMFLTPVCTSRLPVG